MDLCQSQYVWQHATGIGRYFSGYVWGHHGALSRVGGLGAGKTFRIDHHMALGILYAAVMDIGGMAERHLA